MAQPLNQDLITVVNVITSEHLKEREKFTLVISSVPCTWNVPWWCYGIEWWGFWALKFNLIQHVSTSVAEFSQNLQTNLTYNYLRVLLCFIEMLHWFDYLAVHSQRTGDRMGRERESKDWVQRKDRNGFITSIYQQSKSSHRSSTQIIGKVMRDGQHSEKE